MRICELEISVPMEEADRVFMDLDLAVERGYSYRDVMQIFENYNFSNGTRVKIKLIFDENKLVDFIAPWSRYLVIVNMRRENVERLIKTRRSRMHVINQYRDSVRDSFDVFYLDSLALRHLRQNQKIKGGES